MALYAPSPFVAFFPLEDVTSKIDLNLTIPLYSDSSIDIELRPRQIDASKSIRKPETIVRVEDA